MANIKIQGKLEKQQGIYYEVDPNQRPLGIGGMGKVYAGVCVKSQTGERRPVAIKFMYEDLTPEALDRTRREASIQLRNDNLIEMLGFSETEDELADGSIVKHYHVASELLEGVTLADILEGKLRNEYGKEIPFAVELYNEYKNSPNSFAEKIVRAVLAGVMALHDAGYIHRDIDPSNIMVTVDGHIKLIDFGIAKKIDSLGTDDKSMTVSGQFMGKPEYAAPELALGDVRSQNRTTDIYAVGILLFQCVTGHVPFRGPSQDVLDAQHKTPIPINEISDRKLKEIIRKATEKYQSKRFQSAAEFITAFEKTPQPKLPNAFLWAGVTITGMIVGAVLGFLF